MRKLALGTLAIILAIGISGCITIDATPETPDTKPLMILLPEPVPLPTDPTHTQLILRVVERLTNLAQTSEAKEYVSFFLTEPITLIEYFSEDEFWSVGISNGSEAYDLIKVVDWFKVANVDYFFDSHWDEPRPLWAVFQDGRIVPMGKGILVEADIEQLNTFRTLK